jgi:hypothetical protein
MHRRLLVTRVDDAEVLIGDDVQERQDMIARQREDISHAFELQRFAD